MNKVLIAFEPLKRYCTISIDGERVSEYSEIAGCETKDLHVSGSRVLTLLDSEICSEYELTLCGDPFLVKMMDALSHGSEWCRGVKGEVNNRFFSIDETLSFVKDFTNRYHLDIPGDLTVYANGDAVKKVSSGLVVESDTQFNLVITSGHEDNSVRGTILVLSDHYEIRNERGKNIVTIPADEVNEFCRYFGLYTKQIPYIENVFVQSRYVTMTAFDAAVIEAFLSQKPKYVLDFNESQVDVGSSVKFSFKVFPQSHDDAYLLRVNDDSIAEIRGSQVIGLREGTTKLEVVDKSANVCESRSLKVIWHSYVTSIRLMTLSKSIEVGTKGHIDAYLNPSDAEDCNALKWSSSNTDVIHITPDGDIIALKTGTAVITASCTKCQESIKLRVQPSLERISISPSDIRMEYNQTATIQCNLYPPDSAHGQVIWELSNDGMGSISASEDGLSCCYTPVTTALTKGTLTCRIKGTDKSATCSIETLPEDKPVGLMTCAIIFTILACVFSFAIPIAWLGGAGLGAYFADIFMPVSLVLCLVGRSKTDNQEKIFSTCLSLNLIFTIIMFLLAIVACNPR